MINDERDWDDLILHFHHRLRLFRKSFYRNLRSILLESGNACSDFLATLLFALSK